MSIRDIEADYKEAYIAEHAALTRAGRSEKAAEVADVLRTRFGHEVDSAKKRAPQRKAPERADVQKPAENTAEPKPTHKEVKDA